MSCWYGQNSSWYVHNKDIHRDLDIPLFKDEIRKVGDRHADQLCHHVNADALTLLDNQHHIQRLKRTKLYSAEDLV